MIILSCLLPAVSDDIFQHSLPMNLHKHQLHLQEQHSESFNIWSAIIRINTVGKSLIMKSSPNQNLNNDHTQELFTYPYYDHTQELFTYPYY